MKKARKTRTAMTKVEKEKKRDSSLRFEVNVPESSEHRESTVNTRSRARRDHLSPSLIVLRHVRSRSRRRRRSSRSRSSLEEASVSKKEAQKISPKHRSKSRERKERSSSGITGKQVELESHPKCSGRSHTPSRRRRSRSWGRRSFSISPSRRSLLSRKEPHPKRETHPEQTGRTDRRAVPESAGAVPEPIRRRSRSVVRRRSFSISPVRLRRSRTPLRRRFSRSPIKWAVQVFRRGRSLNVSQI